MPPSIEGGGESVMRRVLFACLAAACVFGGSAAHAQATGGMAPSDYYTQTGGQVWDFAATSLIVTSSKARTLPVLVGMSCHQNYLLENDRRRLSGELGRNVIDCG